MHLNPTQREKRQLDLMRERLLLYRNGRITLQELVADLDGLIDSLELQEPTWKRSIRDLWSVLEEVYAVSLDKGGAALAKEHGELVAKTIDQIGQMLSEFSEQP